MDRLTQLPGGKHRGIFARAVQRLAANEPEAEAFLHALTYARGSGFPRTGGIWAIAGSALSDLSIQRQSRRQGAQGRSPIHHARQ
jgi:hypothetical protein